MPALGANLVESVPKFALLVFKATNLAFQILHRLSDLVTRHAGHIASSALDINTNTCGIYRLVCGYRSTQSASWTRSFTNVFRLTSDCRTRCLSTTAFVPMM